MSRDHVISVRLTDGQHRALAARARLAGCSVSDLIRRLVVAPAVPDGMRIGGGAIACPAPSAITWYDGTPSGTWPALNTG